MLTVGSLFTGVGALDLGLMRTGGFHVVFHIEKEPFCQLVLRERYPEVPIYSDICECFGYGASSARTHLLPAVDVLVGGFPCQDISTSGRQKGIEEGQESGLWREFARLIGELRPRYVIVENVAALRSPTTKKGVKRRAGLGRVLGDLATLRYDAEWHCIPASRLGAPHQRDRIFIMAYRDGLRWHDGGDTGRTRPLRADQERDTQETRADGQQLLTQFGQNGQNHGRRTELANAAAVGLERPELLRQPDSIRSWSRNAGSIGYETTDDGDLSQDAPSKSCMGGDLASASYWLDAVGQHYRWPARPGERQHPWEPPRVIIETVPNRIARIKALGNAVVVAVGEAVGTLLLERIAHE